jgi:DNA-binding response OmpR family regulator
VLQAAVLVGALPQSTNAVTKSSIGPPRRLLVVEDETNIRDLVCLHLDSEGYACVPIADGSEALALLKLRPFDLIVLDLMLKGVDGLSICRTVRQEGPNQEAPILMLTARREEPDKLAGFESGADDYLTKPFSMKELSARIGALTRRRRTPPFDPLAVAPVISRSDLELDPARRTVRLRGADVPVTPHEFRVLYRLASEPGVVFTRERLLAEVWLGETFVTERSIDTLVRRLRCKIERDASEPTRLLTIWGEGYKFHDG